MFSITEVTISNLIVHSVGNKLRGESLLLSGSPVAVGSELEEVLMKFMFSPFKSKELFTFNNLASNAVYQSAQSIFQSAGSFSAESKKLAKHLFEEANAPKAAGGNLFLAYFKGFIVNDVQCDGLGLFKSEVSDTFLKVKHSGERVAVEREAGISVSKLAKGALIFNIESSAGYVVSLVDKRARGEELSYWRDTYLDVIPRKDNYYQTKNAMTCVEQFVSAGLPDLYADIDRSQQVDLLHRSLDYFKDNEVFDWAGFAKEIFVSPAIIEDLGEYKTNFEHDYDVEIAEKFDIDVPAVKSQARAFKSVIKLDDKFDIIIHKDKENLIHGKDKETGLNYYQLLFKHEQ